MNGPSYRYTAKLADEIEAHWRDHWETEGTFRALNLAGPQAEPEKVDSRGERLFVLGMSPYPSDAGLHIGHPPGYIAADTFACFNRMKGRSVLHALGYNALGLPAEQYAVQPGQHPRVTTEHNIVIMRRQPRRLGLAHNPCRSVATVDAEFCRWTQWIFLQIFNVWFDEAANKVRHIDELVEEFAFGKRPTPSGRPWEELPMQERCQIIDSHRLAYLSEAPVNWCPGLGTMLANEEVTNGGRSEIGNFPVFKRNMSQWMLRITAYTGRLLADLDKLDWPDKVKAMQRNWIGRSGGARVFFTETASGERIEVLITRPDTLLGATFVVLAPEYHLADGVAFEWPEGTDPTWAGGHVSLAEVVAAYRAEVERRTDADCSDGDKEKTGLFTGHFAVNPINDQRIPIFIADYVTLGYGTGAIVAVPSDDQRDWEFTKVYNLPIVETMVPCLEHDDNSTWVGDGEVINSADPEISLNGTNVSDAKTVITEWLKAKGLDEATVNYRLRDWLLSHQRYWGEPFPIVYDETGLPIALSEEMLPIELPEVTDYSPKAMDLEDRNSDPVPPLIRATDWTSVELDPGDGKKIYRHELNVMSQWAGSCWYEMRYLDPANHGRFVGEEVERYWVGPRSEGDVGEVNLYVGRVEHAMLHLLYARSWYRVLFDLGFVSSVEPFRRLFDQGYIQAYAYRDSHGQTMPAAEVEAHGEGQEMTWAWQDWSVKREYRKMGKLLKNIVSPDEMYEAYGADTFRLYEMGMGPLTRSKPRETRAVVGSQRFPQRLWRNVADEETGDLVTRDTDVDEATLHALYRTIDAVNRDYENLSFNTAIARLTECNTVLTALRVVPRAAAGPLVLMVAPLAPHIAEELWRRLGYDQSLAHEPLPVADPELVVEDTITAVVQAQDRPRAQLEVSVSITEDESRELALAHPYIVKEIPNGVRRVIVRTPKLVNVVPV